MLNILSSEGFKVKRIQRSNLTSSYFLQILKVKFHKWLLHKWFSRSNGYHTVTDDFVAKLVNQLD